MTDPRLVGPRFGVPHRERRWCIGCEVSALEEKECWMCGGPTIRNDEWLKLAAERAQQTYGKIEQHGGERG